MVYWMWIIFFFFKQKTAYEMRISDWSSDVCSSDLLRDPRGGRRPCGEGVVIASAIFRSKRHHDCGNLTFPAAHSAAASAQQDASRHAETQAIPAAADRRRPARRELPPGPRGASRGAGGGLRRTDLGPDPRRRREIGRAHV